MLPAALDLEFISLFCCTYIHTALTYLRLRLLFFILPLIPPDLSLLPPPGSRFLRYGKMPLQSPQ